MLTYYIINSKYLHLFLNQFNIYNVFETDWPSIYKKIYVHLVYYMNVKCCQNYFYSIVIIL